jgi:hypothetical protein
VSAIIFIHILILMIHYKVLYMYTTTVVTQHKK